MKKYWIAIIAAVAASLLFTALSLAARPDIVRPQDCIDSAQSMLDYASITAVNAVFDDNHAFEVQAADAQLYISGIDSAIGALVIDFDAPQREGTLYQLFYSSHESGISEANSISGRMEDDSDILIVKLPEFTDYDLLRLDIDVDYQLDDLAVIDDASALTPSDSYLAAIIKGRFPFPVGQLALCLVIFLCEALLIAWRLDALKERARRLAGAMGKRGAGWLRNALIGLGGLLAGAAVWLVLRKTGVAHSESRYTLFAFALIGLAIAAMLRLRGQLGAHPERGFLVAALCVGLLFAVLEPPTLSLSWDDETHYGRIVSLSYGTSAFMTQAERTVTNHGIANDVNVDNKAAITGYLNALPYQFSGDETNTNAKVSLVYIPSYLPAAAALWLTRTLGMSFSLSLMAGRVANLLCYVLAVYFAIRQLKYGKLFVSSLGLLPTMLFLAGNYSYDAFCVGFILLGTCLWLGVWQTPGTVMTGQRATAMLLALVVGVITKAIYFPLLLIVLLLPSDRFASREAARRYRIAVVAATLLMIVSFVLPFLTGQASYTDFRGGGDVDAMAQVAFVLHHPFTYALTLLKYLAKEYFSYGNVMNQVGGCVRAFAYVGAQGVVFPEMLACLLVALVLAAWVGSSEEGPSRADALPVWLKVVAAALGFGTICLAATSLYCAYTPVGADTINGFQERYMLPVMVPLLLLLRPTFLKNSLSRDKFNTAVMGAEFAVLLAGMWPMLQRFL